MINSNGTQVTPRIPHTAMFKLGGLFDMLIKQDKPVTEVQTLIQNCQLVTGIENLKWPKCSGL